MDTGYLLIALRSIRDESTSWDRPWQYQEALDWLIEYVDQNYFAFEDILDAKREAEDAERT